MSDPWTHQKKHWQDVLDAARKRGWPPPVKARDHGGVTLKCPDPSSNCGERIYTTGDGSESVAIRTLRKIERCPHGDFTDLFDRVENILTNAQRLMRAARLELERADRESHALDLLREVESPLLSAQETLDQLEQEYFSVVEDEQRLSSELDRELTTDDPTEPRDLTGEAASGVRRARLDLRGLPSAHERHQLLSAQLAEASAELAQLQRMV